MPEKRRLGIGLAGPGRVKEHRNASHNPKQFSLGYAEFMLDLDRLETIIRDNRLPARIKDSGQAWVTVELTDNETGLSKTLTMGKSDFADLILHWRQHGCHIHPCPAMSASVADEGHP